MRNSPLFRSHEVYNFTRALYIRIPSENSFVSVVYWMGKEDDDAGAESETSHIIIMMDEKR